MTKCRGELSNGIVFLLENTRTHVAKTKHLKKFQWEVLQYPPYSPDISPYDFDPLKKSLKGLRFTCDKEVQATLEKWIRKQPRSFYLEATLFLCTGISVSMAVY